MPRKQTGLFTIKSHPKHQSPDQLKGVASVPRNGFLVPALCTELCDDGTADDSAIEEGEEVDLLRGLRRRPKRKLLN